MWTQISATGSVPKERMGHTATVSPTESGFYVFGGDSIDGRRLSEEKRCPHHVFMRAGLVMFVLDAGFKQVELVEMSSSLNLLRQK